MKKLILATLVAGLCFVQGSTAYAAEPNATEDVCVVEKESVMSSGTFQQTIQWRIVGDTLEIYSKTEKAVLPDASEMTLPWEEYKSSIKKVCINSDISEIGAHMFEKMTALEEVEINTTSLVKVGDFAFNGCKQLKKINLPNNLKELGVGAFYQCTQLSAISDKGFVLPSGITEIPSHCFEYCFQFKKLTIPANVQKIASSAFCCSALEDIVFEKGNLKELGNMAFAMTPIKNIVLPGTIETIDSYVFMDCKGLETVTFEDNGSLKTVEQKIFEGCSSLTKVYVPAGTKIQEYCNNDSSLKNKYCVRTSMTATSKNFSIWFDNGNQTCIYTGKSIEPKVNVFYLPESRDLEEGADYTVSYANNINAGTAKVIITGVGAFYGTIEEEFSIYPKALSNAVITLDKSKYYWDGMTEEVNPQVKSVVMDGKTLIAGKDYIIGKYEDNDKITSQAYVTIIGLGNYTAHEQKQFSIYYNLKKNSKNLDIDVSKKSYTGKAVKPSLTVSYRNGDGWSTISKNNYKVTYSNNKKVGKNAKVTITGKGLYEGTVTKKFTITPQKPKVKKSGKLLKISNYQSGAEVRIAYTVTKNGKKQRGTLVCKAKDYKKNKGVNLSKLIKKYKGKAITITVTMKINGVESEKSKEIVVR